MSKKVKTCACIRCHKNMDFVRKENNLYDYKHCGILISSTISHCNTEERVK